MIGLRVGAVMAARKRGYGSKVIDPQVELKQLSELEHDKIKDMDIKINEKTLLKFRKVPYLEWGAGIVFLAAAIFCEYFLHTAHAEIGIAGWSHSWT